MTPRLFIIPLQFAAFLLGAAPPRLLAQAPAIDKDHAAKMARGTELFKQHVRPALVQHCLKCHGGKSTEAGLDLATREALLKGGERGPAVLPGRGPQSLLTQLITHAREPHMPEGRPRLANDVIAHIITWIDLGAPYDEPLTARAKPEADWTKTRVPDTARAFWSFGPLHRTPPPAVRDAAWCRTPVDGYVRAAQESAGLAPNPEADRRRLIRRLALDLTGLPPTPAEVDAFAADSSPGAYERLVDRLLASPRHGERWARHWLDLSRFAESHGFEHDYDRPTAYPYRDFVVRALNDDLPYDTFVKWQIAGDEYGPDNPLALAATGFLAAGVHSTQITQNEVERHRYDELDDMLATIGTSMLGLTLGCARCHDHKYDPVPAADYYRLLATFTTTVRSEVEIDTTDDAYRRAKAAFDREHAPLVAALQTFVDRDLPARLAGWEKAGADRTALNPWQILDLASVKSAGGATLTKLPDGSVRAGGPNPTHETYTFTALTDQRGITGFRLESLSDPSLVKGGPGRASNGNFALTELTVTSAPRSGGPAVPVKLKNPRATFEQKGLPAAAAIDNNPGSGWAIDPQFGKDHALAVESDSLVGFEGGTLLTFTLRFNNNTGHSIARPRLSLTTSATPPALGAGAMPAAAQEALRIPAPQRTPAQTAAILAWYRTVDPEARNLEARVNDHLARLPRPPKQKALISTEGLAAVRLHTQGGDFLPATHFLRRGDPNQKQGEATQGFLQVLTPDPDGAKRWQTAPQPGSRTSYRRRALAEWLTDTEHGAGRLLARVIVNRLWLHHLGRGLVATPSDFGTRGDPPSNPALLDDLASELISNGWRLKPIHRLIVTSAAYRQDSARDETKVALDRDNRLVWRRTPRRLEAEALRDAMLFVSGRLDSRPYGPGTLDPASARRSIYFTVKRSQLVPMMVVFDGPEALSGLAERATTTVAPQALYLMNNAQVRLCARALARRAAPDAATPPDAALRDAYRTALGRAPDADELQDGLAFLTAQAASYQAEGKSTPRDLALTDLCQAILCLNEFAYLE